MLFPLKDELTPLGSRSRTAILFCAALAAANNVGQDLHPAFLVLGGIGVKVDDFAVVEADTEALLDEHVAFLFFSKSRAASLAGLGDSLLLRECSPIIDESLGVGKVDARTRLTGGFVVSCQLGADKLKVATTPVLSKG